MPSPQEVAHVYPWSPSTDAGVFVNEATAVSCSTAWACGSLIARSIAMLLAQVLAPRSNDADDGAQRLVGHPVENLLHRESNPEMSAMAFRERLLLSGVFHGNGYAEIERDKKIGH